MTPADGTPAEALFSRGPSMNREHRPRWGYLPGTEKESQNIAGLWRGSGGVALLTGAAASKPTLRVAMPRARFIHLATHGFFADPSFRSAFQHEVAREQLSLGGFEMAGRRATVTGRSPLILSGVVLAGANQPPKLNEWGAPMGDDGILTAEEVVELDLSGTELVMLSACETGLGEVAGGEGVFGLQRAFHQAGARTTVASLWKVHDAATQQLMERFYDNLWRKKLAKSDALREAQLWMLREVPKQPELLRGITRGGGLKFLEEDIQKEGRLPPYYWAGFVLSGDWR